MELYSVEKNGKPIFYIIEAETKKEKKVVLTATLNSFESFCFTPLNAISLNADEVIVVDKREFDANYPSNYALNFKGNESLFQELYSVKALGTLKALQDDGKGILKTNEKHLILKVILSKLLDLREPLWDLRKCKDYNSFSMPIIINNENIVKTVDELLINKFGTDWKGGLNYPSIVNYNGGGRLCLYMSLYYTSLGLDVYDSICNMLKINIYYHKEMELDQFKKENENILKYFKPETYGIKTISKVDSVYLDFNSSRTPYSWLDLDDEVMISFIKKVITDYYKPIYKKSMLKEIFKLIKAPDNICSKKEFKKILKDIFLTFGYDESLIEKGNKRKYTVDKLKTKEDILKLMNKVINRYEEWWQDCGLLPWSVIDTEEFVEWLKNTRPKSFENATLCAKKDGTLLENLDLDTIIGYATGGTAYLIPDNKKGLKNIEKTKIINVASEYKSRDEEKREMELVAEYALIKEDVTDYLLEVVNEAFD